MKRLTQASHKVAVILFVALVLLTGCIPAPIAQWIAPPQTTTQSTELRIAVWSSGDVANKLLQAIVDEYQMANGVATGDVSSETNSEGNLGAAGEGDSSRRIAVELQILSQYSRELIPLLQSDAPPDILLVDTFTLPSLVSAAYLSPLVNVSSSNSSAIGLPASLSDDLYPEMQHAFTIDEKLYCVPREFTTLALVYNRTLFQQAELSYPSQGWTWDDLQRSAQTLTEATNPFYSTFGLALDADFSRWMPFMAQAGAAVTDASQTAMTIDSAESLQSLEFYLGLALDGYAAEPSSLGSSWAGEAFGNGRVGMMVEGSWVIPYLDAEFPNIDYDIVPLPQGPNQRATVSFGNCYAINSNSPNQNEALRLIQHLTSSETMSRWQEVSGLLPTRVSLELETQANAPASAAFYDSLPYAVPWQLPPGFDALVDTVNGSMQQVLEAEIDPAEVVRVGRVVGTDILENQ